MGQQNELEKINILVVGAPSSGKTTFVQTFSELPVGGGATMGSNPRRDLADLPYALQPPKPDYGRFTTDNETVIYLFGHGKQDVTFILLLEKLMQKKQERLGYIVVVDTKNGATEANTELDEIFLEIIQQRNLPYIVAVNKMDKPDAYSVEDVRKMLELGDDVPMFGCSAKTDPASVRDAVVGLLQLMPQDEVVLRAIDKLRGMFA